MTDRDDASSLDNSFKVGNGEVGDANVANLVLGQASS